MILRPFFSFFGSKWRLAPKYPTPKHRLLIEPFAGSAGYALRHYDRDVVLCDADPVIVSIWQFLIKATPDDIRSLPLLPDDDAEVSDLDLPTGADHLIGFWLSRSSAVPKNRPNAWMKKHSANVPGCFWTDRVRERIAKQVSYISHWEIVDLGYQSINRERATWFIDPPYREAGTRYRYGSQQIDYTHLGTWCRSLPGQVIVCENEGADWLPFFPFATQSGTRKDSREMIYQQGEHK